MITEYSRRAQKHALWGLVALAALGLFYVALQARCEGSQAFRDADVAGCLEFWLNRYQTLVGVLVAVGAALTAYAGVKGQVEPALKANKLMRAQISSSMIPSLQARLHCLTEVRQRLMDMHHQLSGAIGLIRRCQQSIRGDSTAEDLAGSAIHHYVDRASTQLRSASESAVAVRNLVAGETYTAPQAARLATTFTFDVEQRVGMCHVALDGLQRTIRLIEERGILRFDPSKKIEDFTKSELPAPIDQSVFGRFDEDLSRLYELLRSCIEAESAPVVT